MLTYLIRNCVISVFIRGLKGIRMDSLEAFENMNPLDIGMGDGLFSVFYIAQTAGLSIDSVIAVLNAANVKNTEKRHGGEI